MGCRVIDEIICGDCLEVMRGIPDNSIDLVLTDPPYGINKGKIANDESLDAFQGAVETIFPKMADNSFFVSFTSIANIPQMTEIMSRRFTYRWQIIVYINNGMVRGSMGFSVYYPCLIYTKGQAKIKKQIKDVFETSASSKQMANRQHPYQKDVRFHEYLLNCMSKEGDLILDPFLGSGTTAVACVNLDRDYIGIDISEEYCNIARQRVADAKMVRDSQPELFGR